MQGKCDSIKPCTDHCMYVDGICSAFIEVSHFIGGFFKDCKIHSVHVHIL